MPENCAFTTQHDTPDLAQREGAPPTSGLKMVNGGLQVVNPSTAIYGLIQARLESPETINFDFADQSLLSDLFPGRWVPLSYKYNALKFMREIHAPIWRDNEIKNLHYLLSPKPWNEDRGKESQETHKWWWSINQDRLDREKEQGIADGF